MKGLIVHNPVDQGAAADAREVLDQVRTVGEALDELGIPWEQTAFTLDVPAFVNVVKSAAPDVVFNLVESVGGDERMLPFLPTLLDHLAIPYTGSRSWQIAATSNKRMAKSIMMSSGLPTPVWMTRDAGMSRRDFKSGHYILKSVSDHGSVGLEADSVVRITGRDELQGILEERFQATGREWMAEKYIEGREFNLSMLAIDGIPQVLEPAEMVFGDAYTGRFKIVGYRAKWDTNSPEYNSTRRSFDFHAVDFAMLDELRALALACWNTFDLDGYVRVDFRVNSYNAPFILEVNCNPSIADDAGFLAAAEQTGMSVRDTIGHILADAVGSEVWYAAAK